MNGRRAIVSRTHDMNLDQDSLEEIVSLAVRCGLARRGRLVGYLGLDPTVVASIGLEDAPIDQIRRDLRALAELPSHPSPLIDWLEVAIGMASEYPEAKRLRWHRETLRGATSRDTGPLPSSRLLLEPWAERVIEAEPERRLLERIFARLDWPLVVRAWRATPADRPSLMVISRQGPRDRGVLVSASSDEDTPILVESFVRDQDRFSTPVPVRESGQRQWCRTADEAADFITAHFPPPVDSASERTSPSR